jgi:peptide deformylase
MALRKILTQGDTTLEKISRPVTNFDERLHILLDDMRETLARANGMGLAAPQVGILRRVVLVMSSQDEVIELVNPVILSQEGEQDGLEGCLSVPGYYGMVKRPMKVRVRAQDRYGNEFEVEDVEQTARCFCHELEHLDGHLFTEHAEKLYTVEELDQMMNQEAEEAKV